MIQYINDPNEIKLLKGKWNDLAAHSQSPLLQYEWFEACAEAFCPPGRLHILINWSSNKINAIAPLVFEKSFGLNKLGILGASFLGEPNGFIYNLNFART